MPHHQAINIGQMPQHFSLNCNKWYVYNIYKGKVIYVYLKNNPPFVSTNLSLPTLAPLARLDVVYNSHLTQITLILPIMLITIPGSVAVGMKLIIK